MLSKLLSLTYVPLHGKKRKVYANRRHTRSLCTLKQPKVAYHVVQQLWVVIMLREVHGANLQFSAAQELEASEHTGEIH